MKRLIYPAALLLIFAFDIYLFISKSALLVKPFIGTDCPIGTLAAWSLFISLALLIQSIKKKYWNSLESIYKITIYTSSSLALLWGFAARALAGNWAYNFNNSIPHHTLRFDIFKYYTIGILILLVLAIAIRILDRMIKR